MQLLCFVHWFLHRCQISNENHVQEISIVISNSMGVEKEWKGW